MSSDPINLVFVGDVPIRGKLCDRFLREPAVMEVNGRTIALLSVAEGEFAQAHRDGAGAARLDLYETARQTSRLSDKYDHVVVAIHGGNEYSPVPSPRVVAVFRALADSGADAVIGHHPHVPQGVERHGSRPFCYSLGNFLFSAKGRREDGWHLSAVLQIELGNDETSTQLSFFRWDEEGFLEMSDGAGRTAWDTYMRHSEEILHDPEFHQRCWDQQVRESFREFWPRWRPRITALRAEDAALRRRQRLKKLLTGDGHGPCPPATLVYNLVCCDAHRELLQTAGRLMHQRRFQSDEEEAERRLGTPREHLRRARTGLQGQPKG